VEAFMLQPARFDQLFRYNTGLWQTNDSKNRASIVSRCKSGRNVVYWNIVHDTRTELNWSGVHATAGGLNSHAPPTLSQRRRRGSAVLECVGVRTQGQMWSADPRGKMDTIRYDTRCYFNVRKPTWVGLIYRTDEKLKAKTCKKEQFSSFMLYFESNQV